METPRHTVERELIMCNIVAANGGVIRIPYGDIVHEGETLLNPGVRFKTSLDSVNVFLAFPPTLGYANGLGAEWINLTDEEKAQVETYVLEHFPAPADLEGLDTDALLERYRLRRMNLSFIREHGDLDADDFAKMRSLTAAIEGARDFSGNPVSLPGDTVVGAYHGGKHPFEKGMLDTPQPWYGEDELNLCAGPYPPFVSLTDRRPEGYSFSMSGGPFFKIAPADLEYAGTDVRVFTDFGHDGPCKDGAFVFPAKVNRWKVKPGTDI